MDIDALLHFLLLVYAFIIVLIVIEEHATDSLGERFLYAKLIGGLSNIFVILVFLAWR